MAFLILASTAISSTRLLGSDATPGLAGDVAGTDAGEHRLGLQWGEVLLRLTGQQFSEQGLEPVNCLDPAAGQGLAAVGQHPQRLELPIDFQDSQPLGADRDDGDRVRVEGVGLAVVAGVEESNPGGESRRDVDDLLAGLEEALGQGAPGAVGALDRPDPFGPGLRTPDIEG